MTGKILKNSIFCFSSHVPHVLNWRRCNGSMWTPWRPWHVQHVTTPVRRPRARAYITRHLLVPEASQADTWLTPTRALWARVGATGHHAVVLSPLGVRIALVARTCLGRVGVNYVTDAPRGSRSCRTRTGLTRRGIPLGVGDSHGPYERPAHSRLAPRAHTVRAWGLVGLVRPRGAPRGACSDAVRASRGLSMRDVGSTCARVVATRRALLPPPLGMHNGHVPGLRWAPRVSGAAHGATRRSTTLTQMHPVHAPTFEAAVRGAETHPVTPDTLGTRVVAVLGSLIVAVGW